MAAGIRAITQRAESISECGDLRCVNSMMYSRLVVRGVSRASEILSAYPVCPDLAEFGGGMCLHCDDDDTDGGRCHDD